MEDLWTLKPENEKTLTKQIEQASQPPKEYNDRLTRFQNIITYGLKTSATPEDWFTAINWLQYLVKELERKHKNNREAIEESHKAFVHLAKVGNELAQENVELREQCRQLWQELHQTRAEVVNIREWMVKNAGYDPECDYSQS